MDLPAGLFESAFALGAGVAPVGIHRFAGVARIEQGLEYGGVGYGGVGDGDLADELVTLVHAGVQFVAEVRFTVLFGPARVDIFLRTFVGFPSQGHGAVFDGVSLVPLVALYWRLHQRGINDLTAAGNVAMFLQLLLGLLDHQRAGARLGQAVAEQPDRLGVGDIAALGQLQKLQETAPVEQLVLERVVGQVVKLLEHQDLDHQHSRIRRTTAFGA